MYQKIIYNVNLLKVISIDSLILYENKCYPQVHLDNCVYKIANKQTKDDLDDNIFDD